MRESQRPVYMILDLKGAMQAGGATFHSDEEATLWTRDRVDAKFLKRITRLPAQWRQRQQQQQQQEKPSKESPVTSSSSSIVAVHTLHVLPDETAPCLPDMPADDPFFLTPHGLPDPDGVACYVVLDYDGARESGCVFTTDERGERLKSDREVPGRYLRRLKQLPRSFRPQFSFVDACVVPKAESRV
jgi:hypothetical protein